MTEGNSPNDLIIEGIRLNLPHCEEHPVHFFPEHMARIGRVNFQHIIHARNNLCHAFERYFRLCCFSERL